MIQTSLISLSIIHSKDVINAPPSNGLLVLEYDTGKTKWGDGVTKYEDLPYVSEIKLPVEEPPIEEPPVEGPKKIIEYSGTHVPNIDDLDVILEFQGGNNEIVVPANNDFKIGDKIAFVSYNGPIKISTEPKVTLISAVETVFQKAVFGMLVKRSENEWYLWGGELKLK